MLFLQASIVFWLQTLRYWWENNTLFIVDVSRVYANSSSEDRKETIWNVHTHTAFLKIKKIRIYNFHESNIKFHLHSLKVSANVKIVMQCFETFLGEMPPPWLRYWREMTMHLWQGFCYCGRYLQEHEVVLELKFSCQGQLVNVVFCTQHLFSTHCWLRCLSASVYICTTQTVQLWEICVFNFTFTSPHIDYWITLRIAWN